MHYWRGQSLKLHCGCGYLGLEKTPADPANPHPSSAISQWLPNKTCSSSFVLPDWLQSPRGGFVKTIRGACWVVFLVSSCIVLFFFGIHSLVRPTMLTLLKRYRAVNTEYCKCYNYSCMSAFPCVFVMPASIQNCTAAIFLLW